jgi:hypothetical protein
MFTKNNLKTNAVAEAVAKILEAELDESLKGGQKKIDKNHNGKIDAHDFKLLRGEKNESVEPIDEGNITHILSKELVSDHKRWMDSEGFDTKTKPLPKSHPKHATHVGIVSKDNKESSYHEDGFARPIKESVESIDELSKGTLMSYVKKGEKEQGKNFDDIISAHKGNDQTKANKANAKYLKRNAGLDRAVDKMYSKYDKKTEEVEIDEADHLTMRGLHTANPQSIPSYMRSTEKGKKSLADKNKPILKDLIKRQLGKHPKPNLPEEVEEIDELSKSTVRSYANKKSAELSHVPLMPFKRKPMSDRENRNADKGMMGALKRLNKEEVEELDEISTAQMSHQGKTTLKHIKNPGVGLRMAAHDVKPGIKGYRDRVDLMRAADAEGKLKKEAAEDLEEKKGDSDLGTFTDNNMGEMSDAQMKDRERIVKGMKKGLAGFKERYGKRAKDVMYATATKQAMKDEAVDPKAKTTDTLAGRVKGGDENQHTSYKVKLKTEAMGCENTPMSRATNLAKAAYKKLKNETMMGKAGGTSEEKE